MRDSEKLSPSALVDLSQEIRIKGIPVSEGCAFGKLYILRAPDDESIPEFIIHHHEEEEHILRFHNAVKHSKTDLEDLHQNLQRQGNEEAAMVIDAHILMLEDPMITEAVEGAIRSTKKNVESVFKQVIKDLEHQIEQSPDQFFQERSIDVSDVTSRVMSYLRKNTFLKCENIPDDSIVLVKQLIPSQVASFELNKVRGILSEHGGGSCHAALIARSRGIPYVTRVEMAFLEKCAQGKPLLIDGEKGEIIVNPTRNTLAQFNIISSSPLRKRVSSLQKKPQLTTQDGMKLKLYANISDIEESSKLKSAGVCGVGLFRSEYLFLVNKTLLFSENGQYEIYKKLIEKAEGLPVVIRLLDVGGDKDPGYFLHDRDRYMISTIQRGIRFLLKNRRIFMTQLKALLRASVHGDLKILVPFVSDVQEILETKELIKQAGIQLEQKGKAYKKNVPLGSMIEIPSAVMVCDRLAKECDFLSLGTNDLFQFTTGIDRSEASAASGLFPMPLSLIRMIERASQVAKEQNVPFTICGEVASDPFFSALLVGLGVKEFSCALRFIPRVREGLKRVHSLEAEKLLEKIQKLGSASEIHDLLETFLKNQKA